MIYDFNGFDSDSAMGRAAQSVWRVCLNKMLWLVVAGCLALVVLRTTADMPKDMRNLDVVAKLLARQQANAGSAEALRRQVVIADTQQRDAQLRRDPARHSQNVVDETPADRAHRSSQVVAPPSAREMPARDIDRSVQRPRVTTQ